MVPLPSCPLHSFLVTVGLVVVCRGQLGYSEEHIKGNLDLRLENPESQRESYDRNGIKSYLKSHQHYHLIESQIESHLKTVKSQQERKVIDSSVDIYRESHSKNIDIQQDSRADSQRKNHLISHLQSHQERHKNNIKSQQELHLKSHLEDQYEDHLGAVLSQVKQHYLAGCYLVLVTTANNPPIFNWFLRQMLDLDIGVVVVVVVTGQDPLNPPNNLLVGGETKLPCRAILVFLLHSSYTRHALRFLEAGGLWQDPDVRIVVVGGLEESHSVLLHHTFRNTATALYLAVSHHLLSPPLYNHTVDHRPPPHNHTPPPHSTHTPLPGTYTGDVQGNHINTTRKENGKAKVLWRCLYCEGGEAAVILLHPAAATKTTLPDVEQDLGGHRLRVVTKNNEPYVILENGYDCKGGITHLRQSVDRYMLETLAAMYNFTYDIFEPKDCEWGVPVEGDRWSGTVGTLQHHKADFSLSLTANYARSRVIQFSTRYFKDQLIIVSLKPKKLPKSLALSNPFTGEVWVSMLVAVVVVVSVVWVQQRVWSLISGTRGFSLGTTLTYVWGIMVENPPTVISASTTTRMVLGTWLLTVLVVDSAYRSSLVAHLTVHSTYPPINSFEDLLGRADMSWGSVVITGTTTLLYFQDSSDPVVQKVYQRLQFLDIESGMERIMAGGFSYIDSIVSFTPRVLARYGDLQTSPFHLSSSTYQIYGGNAWGFRKGAPFLSLFSRTQQRLVETGLVQHWEVLATQALVKDLKKDLSLTETIYTQEAGGPEVLGLEHLQGAFYLLLIGHGVALCLLLGEYLLSQYHHISTHTQTHTYPHTHTTAHIHTHTYPHTHTHN